LFIDDISDAALRGASRKPLATGVNAIRGAVLTVVEVILAV
jgi:hypothetical protein